VSQVLVYVPPCREDVHLFVVGEWVELVPLDVVSCRDRVNVVAQSERGGREEATVDIRFRPSPRVCYCPLAAVRRMRKVRLERVWVMNLDAGQRRASPT